MTIYSYQKHTDEFTTHTLVLPVDADGQSVGTELCEIDGLTYVSLPAGEALPVQPEQIAASVQAVVLTTELTAAIKAASPHVALINQRMIDKIRSAYSIDDEMYFARIGVGAANGMYSPSSDEVAAMVQFGAFVESVRQWGRDERAKLGL